MTDRLQSICLLAVHHEQRSSLSEHLKACQCLTLQLHLKHPRLPHLVDLRRTVTQENTPLMKASTAGSVETVKRLLRQGADVHATSPHSVSSSLLHNCIRVCLVPSHLLALQSETALQLAVMANRRKAVGALLCGGADPNAVNSQVQPHCLSANE